MNHKFAARTALRGALALALALSLSAGAWALELVPVGQAVGLEMRLEGVMVAGLAAEDQGGSPAGDAGVLPGDLIVSLDGEAVSSGEQLLQGLANWDGGAMALGLRRGEKELRCEVTPEAGENGAARLGLWLQDSVTGIGTVTFYDPESGLYAALGHGITDTDTGLLLPLQEGVLVKSAVTAVRRGESGAPGALEGQPISQEILGTIEENSFWGIFGKLYAPPEGGEPLTLAAVGEVHAGDAEILCNVSGTQVERFQVRITQVSGVSDDCRDLQLQVTDPALLEKTGGIVQGMSGSPILQDGKLVGAVTHVLIGDPTRGFGILAEHMLSKARELQAA